MRSTRTGHRWASMMVAAILMTLAAATVAPAQTFTTLHTFDVTDGANPYAPLVQATNGSLYGTTGDGGANGSGTIFKITPSGTLTTLYTFCAQGGCADGQYPFDGGLIQATDGNLYGTTYSGGANIGNGTVFRVTPSGTLTTLYSFCSQGPVCGDGTNPYAGLVQGTDGNFYGTTYAGSNGDLCTGGCGTVFKITPAGKLTTLHSFDDADGRDPIGGSSRARMGTSTGQRWMAGSTVHMGPSSKSRRVAH